VLDFFVVYRAAVRAKVAAIAARDEDVGPEQRAAAAGSARRHVEYAARCLAPRPPGALVLVGGVVGTGKSTVAEVLAQAFEAEPGVAVVASDRVRKRLAGMEPLERSEDGPDAGLYAPERVHETYAALCERAEPVLASGRVALLDATWASKGERQRAWQLARAVGARTVFVETRCAEAETLARLRRREASGEDPSDAGPAQYRTSAARFDPPEAEECDALHVVHTDDPGWREEVARVAARVAGAAL
jgi:predicted kinase